MEKFKIDDSRLNEIKNLLENNKKLSKEIFKEIQNNNNESKLLENFNKLTESLENISKLSYKIDDIKVDKIILETTKNENNNFGNFENYYNDINDNYLYINQLTKGEKKYFNIFKDKIN